MRIALKIMAGFAVLVVGVIVAVAIVVATVDVNTLIAPVTARIKAATGRDLAVRGGADIKLSLQPRLVLSDVTLSNAPWGSAPQMLTAKEVQLQVALLPLLSRRFELVEIGLVGPVIMLETDASGRKNWEFPGLGDIVAGKAATAQVPAPFAVGNVAISDGQVSYRDGGSGSVTNVAVNRLSLHARNPQSPIAAQFDGSIDNVAMSLEGTVGPLESLLQRRWPFPVSLKGNVAGRNIAVQTNVRGDDKNYVLDDLKATLGSNAITGSFAVRTGSPRRQLVFDLVAPVLTLADVPVPPGVASAAGASKATTGRLFPDTPVPLGLLRVVDVEGSIAIGRLVLPQGRQLDDVRVRIALNNGQLDVPEYAAKLFGGTAAGSFTVNARDAAAAPAVSVRLDGRGLNLGDMLAATGRPREVRGGKTDVAANLTMRGASPHAWASSMSGNFRATVGRATLINSKLNIDSPIDHLTDAVNPFRKTDASTELLCAVVRLPLASGVAHVDRTIAFETAKVGVSASGTLDFRNETLDFSIKPQLRKGIPIDLNQFASLVRLSGPFTSPQIKVDPVGSAAALATIGAAVSTGGLSAVGQALFSMTTQGGAGPCQVALGQADTASPGGKAESVPAGIEELGNAIGRLFKR